MSGNLGRLKQEQGQVETPITKINKVETPDKTVRVNGNYHKFLKMETAKNGGNVKEHTDKALEEYIKKYFNAELSN